MKKLPQLPYLQNILDYYHQQQSESQYIIDYREFLQQFGFVVPIPSLDYLEFPDDYPDEELTLFILRWS